MRSKNEVHTKHPLLSGSTRLDGTFGWTSAGPSPTMLNDAGRCVAVLFHCKEFAQLLGFTLEVSSKNASVSEAFSLIVISTIENKSRPSFPGEINSVSQSLGQKLGLRQGVPDVSAASSLHQPPESSRLRPDGCQSVQLLL